MILTAMVTLGLALQAGLTWAEDAKTPPSPASLLKALAEAGQPGPEHQKLQPFVGEWNVTAKMWTDPSQPPAECQGTAQAQWIMGGRFVQKSIKFDCHGKTFEGLSLLGYDRGQKKYSAVRVCGVCGTISHGLATSDPSGTRFECAKEECCPLTGQKVSGREEIVIESNDKIVVNIFKTINGKELKVMELVSLRKK
jgi:hypothetical protein